jgi:DNA-binding XRE family transcriptional regulator
MNKTTASPFDQDVVKRLKSDPEYAASYFEEFAKVPVPLQLALLRRLRGVTQQSMASKLHVRQGYISRLEKTKSNHLLSNYEKIARALHSKIIIVPEDAKVTFL